MTEEVTEEVRCQECGQTRPGVIETDIAGQRMDLCPTCLPKLQAMCWPGEA